MEEDILNYLYQLSCFVGHPVYAYSVLIKAYISNIIAFLLKRFNRIVEISSDLTFKEKHVRFRRHALFNSTILWKIVFCSIKLQINFK